MAITHKNSGAENDGNTAAPALAKATLGTLAANDVVVVGLNHTGAATASTPTAPFTHEGTLASGGSTESTLHLYVGKSADWSLEAASFTFPISTARGGCILGWVVGQGDAELASLVKLLEREAGTTPSISAASTRDGALGIAFTGQDPPSGNTTGTAGGTGGTWTERADLSVSATSSLHVQTVDQATAGSMTAQPTVSQSASNAQALVILQPYGDVTPPTASGTPAPGASGVAISTNVVVTFSEAMAPATLTSSTFTLAPTGSPGSPVAATRTWSVGDTVATLNPTSDLAYSTSYTATLTSGLTDVAGNPLFSSPVSWTFTTEAAPAVTTGLVDQQRWAVEVVDRSGNPAGLLDLQGFRLTVRVNGVSELTGRLLAGDPGAAGLEVYSRVVRAWRRHGDDLTGVREIRFAGHIHQLTEEGDQDGLEMVELTALDPFAAFARRYHPWDSSWGPTTLDVAVTGLVGDANISAEDPAGLDASYSHGLGVLAVGGGWPAGSWTFSRHQPVAEAFRGLQEGEAGVQGFYWRVVPQFTVVSGILAAMRIAVAPADLSGLVGQPKPSLEYGPGTRNNLARYQVERVPPVNSVIAVSSTGLAWKNDSETSGATYGLWPVLVSYQDVTTTARLDALARGVWHVTPVDSISVELAWPQDPEARAALPMLWDDFDLGDSLPVYIRGARRTISGTAMVREATVEVDAEGMERTTSIVLELPAAS